MCFWKKKEKEKLIDLYFVTPYYGNDINDLRKVKLLDIESSRDAADKYVEKIIYYKNREHYNMWCQNHEIDQDVDSWNKYLDLVVTDEDIQEYVITRLRYKLSDIADMLNNYAGGVDASEAASY